MVLIMTIYTVLALVAIFMYGSTINNSVLVNIGKAKSADGKVFWENYLM